MGLRTSALFANGGRPSPRRRTALVTCLLLAPLSAQAYSLFPLGGDQYLKWGDNTAGTAGGEVTWSFIPAGTSGSALYCGDACPGTSLDSLNIENGPGLGYTSTLLTDLESYITAAMDEWAQYANITFTKVGDNGVAINDAGAVPPDTGQIRIGVFAFASGGGAVGYAPPPNGGTGSGDILFDANSFYAFNSGGEGDPFDAGSTAPNDFETLLLHELGHAIGMAHPPHTPGGDCPVMDVGGECYGKINRELDADDIAGIQFLYGEATVVPLPTSVWLFGSALIGVLGLARRREA